MGKISEEAGWPDKANLQLDFPHCLVRTRFPALSFQFSADPVRPGSSRLSFQDMMIAEGVITTKLILESLDACSRREYFICHPA